MYRQNFSNQVPAYTGYTVSVKVSDYKFACEDTTNSSIYESIYSQTLRTLIKFNGIDVDDNYDFRKGYQNKSSFSKEYVDILIIERLINILMKTFYLMKQSSIKMVII